MKHTASLRNMPENKGHVRLVSPTKYLIGVRYNDACIVRFHSQSESLFFNFTVKLKHVIAIFNLDIVGRVVL